MQKVPGKQHKQEPKQEVTLRPASLLAQQVYKSPPLRRPHTCQPPSAPAPPPLTHPTLTYQNHGLLWLHRRLRLRLWGLWLQLWGLWPQLLRACLLL